MESAKLTSSRLVSVTIGSLGAMLVLCATANFALDPQPYLELGPGSLYLLAAMVAADGVGWLTVYLDGSGV